VFQLASIVLVVLIFFFISRLLGEATTPYLQQYGGDYFAFVLIGLALARYTGVALNGFASNISRAQSTGTLEALLVTQTSASTIILSSSLYTYLWATLDVFIYLLGGVLLGVDLSRANVPVALLVLGLTIVCFSSLGIMAASFIIVFKRGDPITWLMSNASSLLGGAYFPVSVLPAWLQPLSMLLPTTYALEAMRLALLQGASFAQLSGELIVLAVFALLLLPVSLAVFRYAVRRAKVDGSLTHY
jgi:ABC-2 type transport system permease protein